MCPFPSARVPIRGGSITVRRLDYQSLGGTFYDSPPRCQRPILERQKQRPRFLFRNGYHLSERFLMNVFLAPRLTECLMIQIDVPRDSGFCTGDRRNEGNDETVIKNVVVRPIESAEPDLVTRPTEWDQTIE